MVKSAIVSIRTILGAVLILAIGALLMKFALASNVEFRAIPFNEAEPRVEQMSGSSGYNFDEEQTKILEGMLKTFKKHSNVIGRVTGYSDELECVSSECYELSVRRAKVVYDWLLSHGAPAAQIKGPIGESTRFQPYRGDDRHFNRRVQVEVDVFPESGS